MMFSNRKDQEDGPSQSSHFGNEKIEVQRKEPVQNAISAEPGAKTP